MDQRSLIIKKFIIIRLVNGFLKWHIVGIKTIIKRLIKLLY